MCITLPTKVVSVEGNIAKVNCFGEIREVLLPFHNVEAGDWVLLYAGAVLAVIDEKDALAALEFFERQ